jgi:lipocalin
MKKQINLLLTILIILNSCKGQESVIDNSVVKDLNIDRYLGKWYEIARFDHSFERGLVGVTAHYSMRDDGKIKVVNSGYKESLGGEKSIAIGKAKIPNPNIPSQLKVSFFWIFYGDYFVLELDKDYEWAIIGSSTDKYLWILSRKAQMDKQLYLELLNKLKARGYDTSKLIKVEQRME